jgi:uncharacterized RDD family membrane protein YckC
MRQGRQALTNRPRTAEELAYVGFWRRSWATLLDSLLLAIIVQPLLMSVSSGSPSLGPLEILLGLVLPSIGTVLLWRYKLATPGKMVFRAKVVDASTGGTPSTGQLVGRYFGYLLSAIPLGLGFLWVGWDPRKQGWHDKLAGTVVVARKHDASDRVQFPEST